VAKKKHPHLLLKPLLLHLPHLLLTLLHLPHLLLPLPLHLLKRRSNFFCFQKMPPSGGFFLSATKVKQSIVHQWVNEPNAKACR
jgi:hypothetical protein